MRIDFISDVACPWCAVGLHGLLRGLDQIQGEVEVDLHFQPFELNPDLGPGGRDIVEYLAEKYGATPDRIAATHATLKERGDAVGFAFGPRARTWNTFDAHRLLHWAAPTGRQSALKQALLAAYHGQGLNPSDPAVLRACAEAAGLDGGEAAAVLASDDFADEVRAQERHWQQLGIRAVPSVVVNGRHLIQGGQPPEVYAQALREIAAQADATGADGAQR
jgi:predicted DsbA family dithiol-disulfide isomerase